MQNKIDHKQVWGAGYHAGLKAGNPTSDEWPSCRGYWFCYKPGTGDCFIVLKGRDRIPLCREGYWTFPLPEDNTFQQRKMMIYIQALHVIIRDKCEPSAVHKALFGLAEYRDGLAEDMI